MMVVLITTNANMTLKEAMSTKGHIAANKVRLFVSLIFALVAATLVMYVSWQHNPQCEIHCKGVVHWGYWFTLGASVSIPTFLAAYGLIRALNYVKNT